MGNKKEKGDSVRNLEYGSGSGGKGESEKNKSDRSTPSSNYWNDNKPTKSKDYGSKNTASKHNR